MCISPRRCFGLVFLTRAFLFAGSVLLSVAELYWRSSSPTIALPVLLQALALSKEYRLQHLASETVLNLAFAQVNRSLFI